MKIRDKVDLIGNNVEDILEWAKIRRPDVVDHLHHLKNNQASLLLLSIGYAAGRTSVIAEIEDTTITEIEHGRIT